MDSLIATPAASELEKIHQLWAGSEKTWVGLSVRSGFDTLFSAVPFPKGSEILMSGLTIADMPMIVEQHGLIPIPIDLNISTLSPNLD